MHTLDESGTALGIETDELLRREIVGRLALVVAVDHDDIAAESRQRQIIDLIIGHAGFVFDHSPFQFDYKCNKI